MRFNIKTKYIKKVVSIALVLLVIAGITTRFWPQSASAAWFDENFLYRQAVTVAVASNSSAINNLETLITVDTQTLITAGKLQSSCQDLRFTSSTGKLLSYYIDSGCNTTTTKIWVMVDSIPANSTSYAMYMYYGNPVAVAGSDSQKFTLFRGLVGYWGMNETANSWNGTSGEVKDFSVNANNGTGSGFSSSSPVSGGKYANAGVFDGNNDYVDYPTVLPTTNFTISLWFKTTASVTQTMFTSTDPSRVDGVKLRLDSTGVTRTYVQPNSAALGTKIYNDGTWHQMTVTGSSTETKVYVDGGLDKTYGAALLSGSYTFYKRIGDGGAQEFFNGQIDDTRIYNRALNDSEVKQLYSNPGTIASYTSANALPTTSFSSEEKAPQPVAYWAFDEGTGSVVNDGTSNKNSGTLMNMSSTPASNSGWMTEDMCVSGKCLAFDGSDDYITIPNSNNLNVQTGSFTLSAWIKKTGPSFSGDQNQTIIAKGLGGTYTYTMYVNTSNGVGFAIHDGSHSSTVGSTGTLTVGTWYHVEGVYDGTNIIIYINGKREGSAPKNSFVGITTADPVEIGVWPGQHSGRGKFNGFIDEPKIYPYARTAAQIKADFNARGSVLGTSSSFGSSLSSQPSALSNGLVGYWKMDESSWNGTSGEVRDASGNGNNGTAGCNGSCAGSPPTTSGGRFGNAGYFNVSGSNFHKVSISTSTSLQVSSAVTVCTWLNEVTASANGSVFIDTNSKYLLRMTSSGGLDMQVSTGSVVATSPNTGALSANTWYHICGIYDGSKISLYKDGSLLGSTAKTGLIDTVSGAVIINNAVGATRDLKMDETRIYNRALSPAEVATLYNFAPGPVGYWNLDEKSGTTASDISGNGNTGTWNGTGNHFASGKVGGAGQFNGSNDYVSVGNPASMNFDNGNPFSISSWVNMSQVTYGTIVGKLDVYSLSSGYRGYRLYVNSTGAVSLQLITNWNGGYATAVTTTTTLQANKWYHLSATYDPSSTTADVKIYINGKLDKSSTITQLSTTIQNSNNAEIGRGGSGSQLDKFPGLLDEVKVYNYARSAKQVVEDMNASHPVVIASGARQSSSMVGYWDFDEGYGTSANDLSGNGNTGTLTNIASPATATSGWSNNGKFGKALSFDGSNDYLSMGNPTSLSFGTGDITYSTWLKTSSTNSSYYFVMGKNATSTPYAGAYFYVHNGKVNAYMNTTTTNGLGDGNITISDNNWHHVVVVFNRSGGNAVYYVDGKVDKTISISAYTGSTDNSSNFQVGLQSGGFQSYFNGQLDEMKVYNYALTVDDVKRDYNRGASQLLGSTGTSSSGVNDNSSDRMYCPPGDTTATCGPVGEWNFEEGQGSSVNDSSGNNYTGTITGARFVAGKVGKGLEFNGSSDYVSVADNDSFSANTSNQLTASLWVKLNAMPSATVVPISKTSGGNYEWNIRINNSGVPSFWLTTSNGVGTVMSITSNTALRVGEWTQITATVNLSTPVIQIYLNGISRGSSATLSGTYTNGTSALNFARNGDGGNYAPISLDQVKIYNYARSAAQVAWDYNRGAPVAWYKMDECQGTSVRDMTGNGNNGTLTVGASGTQTSAGTCQTSSTAWGNGASGKVNYSLNFDGTDDYVNIPDSDNLDLTTISMDAWVYPTSISKSYNQVFLKNIGNTSYYGMLIQNNGLLMCQVAGTGGGVTLLSNKTIPINTWTHIACTADGSTVKIYINGKLDKTQSTSVTAAANTSALYIGSDPVNAGRQFTGQIDNVRIYNYPLTPQQIKTLYTGGAVRFSPTTGNP